MIGHPTREPVVAPRPAASTALDGKALLLETKKYAEDIPWRSWFNVLTTLLAIAVALVPVSLALPWWVRLPASIVLGLLFVRFFVIYHDYEHDTILRGSPLAALLMSAFGLFFLTPPSIWRSTHNHHHRHNAELSGEGVGTFAVLTPHEYASASWGQRLAYRIERHPLTIAFGYVTVFLFSMCIKPLIHNPRQHWDAALSLLLHGALVTTLALVSPWVLLYAVVIPMLVGSALGSYLFYAQHNYPDVKLQDPGDWDYVDAALHSSSFIDMGPILHWFTANIGYHHVHHLNSRIPFYRLPEAMAAFSELQSPGTTSLWPKDIWSCLRLDLWDPEKGRMVSFQGR